MTASTAPANIESSPAARVRQRRVDTRRARMLRGLGWMISLSVLAVVVTMYNRDVQAVAGDEKRMAFWRDHLARLHENGGMSPLELPLPPGDRPPMREVFAYNVFYVREAANMGRSAVVYRKGSLPMFLRQSGRHVLVFDGTEFSIEWLRGSLTQARAAELGIRATP